MEAPQSQSRISRLWKRLAISRLPLPLPALALLLVGLGALGTAGWLVASAFGDSDYDGVGEATAFGEPADVNLTAQPTGTAELPPVSDSPIARFSIPRFEVDAPVGVFGVDETGAMETPEDPWLVAWYDFTRRPGAGSNAVFAGHVDAVFTGDPGPAIFFHLKDLEKGDMLEVTLKDGTLLQYQVVSRWSVDPDTADIGSIVGPTEQDVITLITCGGNLGTQYDQRLIVRATRVLDSPASAVGAP